MSYCFEGIGQTAATFAAGTGAAAGKVCKVSAAGTVAGCADGDVFHGVVLHTDGAGAAVVLRGFVTVAYTGTAPTVGMAALLANGTGGVKTDDDGASHLVVDVDATAATVTLWL